eukprot:jgi/Mesen1/9107/ME000058S08606
MTMALKAAIVSQVSSSASGLLKCGVHHGGLFAPTHQTVPLKSIRADRGRLLFTLTNGVSGLSGSGRSLDNILPNSRRSCYGSKVCRAQAGDESSVGSSGFDMNAEAARVGPPQDAVLQAISEVSRVEGRQPKTTNMVIGGTEAYGADWMELDKKVNTYPSLRGFTAIGTGGEDFVQSMVVAVESVLNTPIPENRVRQRESAKGRYVSVKIGPMRIESSEGR